MSSPAWKHHPRDSIWVWSQHFLNNTLLFPAMPGVHGVFQSHISPGNKKGTWLMKHQRWRAFKELALLCSTPVTLDRKPLLKSQNGLSQITSFAFQQTFVLAAEMQSSCLNGNLICNKSWRLGSLTGESSSVNGLLRTTYLYYIVTT